MQNRIARIHTPDDKLYIGEAYGDIFHGFGILYFRPLQSEERDYYKGEFSEGLQHGWGIYYTKTDCWVGRWERGEFAEGVKYTNFETVGADFAYEEDFSPNFSPKTVRTETIDLVSVIIGKISDDYQSPFLLLESSGNVFLGFSQAGMFFGEYILDNGDQHFGEFRFDGNGGAFGIGEWTYSNPENGAKYTGEWVDSLPNGHGKCQYADQSVYYGDWVHGSRESWGVFIDAKKAEIYIGEWLADKKNGWGVSYWLEKTEYFGYWYDNFKKRRGEDEGRLCIYDLI